MQNAQGGLSSRHGKWVFTMLSRDGLFIVLDRLARDRNTKAAVRVLGLLLSKMNPDGTVPLTPVKIASRLEVHPSQVYRALRMLEDMGAVVVAQPSRRQTLIRVSANLASGLAEEQRLVLQAKDPQVSRELAA